MKDLGSVPLKEPNKYSYVRKIPNYIIVSVVEPEPLFLAGAGAKKKQLGTIIYLFFLKFKMEIFQVKGKSSWKLYLWVKVDSKN